MTSIRKLLTSPVQIFGIAISLFVLVSSQLPLSAVALSEEQKKVYSMEISDFDVEESGGVCTSSVDVVGADDPEKRKKIIWNYFIDSAKGLKPFQVAAIIGNIDVETGGSFDPRIVEGGSRSNTPTPGVGYGLVQWTDVGRQEILKRRGGPNVSKLDFQMKHIWWELHNNEQAAYNAFKATTNIRAATLDTFSKLYERPAVWNNPERLTRAQAALTELGSQTDDGGGSDTTVSGTCTSASDGNAFLGTDGYAWPVGLNKADVSAGYDLPCRNVSCHHDGTAAFDLAHKQTVGMHNQADNKSVGVPVYAVRDGKVTKVGIYMGISGCYAIQFMADDGYSYWYGHLRRPVSMRVNQEYKAGEKLAEIGERKCTGNGSYPHLHIDRGSPKGGPGGDDCCRDPGMTTLINKLYEELP